MKRSVAVIVAGFVTTATVMGGTLVAAQSGVFSGGAPSVQRNGDIRISHLVPLSSVGLTNTFEMEYYTETEMLDSNMTESVITDTVGVTVGETSDVSFRSKIYETYDKLISIGANHGVGSGRWSVSDTITSTNHEHDFDVDAELHVFTDTITSTNHERGFDVDTDLHVFTDTIIGTHHEINDDHFHGMTGTITGTLHEDRDDHHVVSGTMTDTWTLHGKGDGHGKDIHVGDDFAVTNTVGITNDHRGRDVLNKVQVDIPHNIGNQSNNGNKSSNESQSNNGNKSSNVSQSSNVIQNNPVTSIQQDRSGKDHNNTHSNNSPKSGDGNGSRDSHKKP